MNRPARMISFQLQIPQTWSSEYSACGIKVLVLYRWGARWGVRSLESGVRSQESLFTMHSVLYICKASILEYLDLLPRAVLSEYSISSAKHCFLWQYDSTYGGTWEPGSKQDTAQPQPATGETWLELANNLILIVGVG